MQPRQRKKKPTPLEAKWEAILEKEGLGDIEHRPSGQLRVYDTFHFKTRYTKSEFDEIETYYSMARALLHEDVFQNAKDKLIWELHSEGHKNNEIAARVKVSVKTIVRRISFYRKYVLS